MRIAARMAAGSPWPGQDYVILEDAHDAARFRIGGMFWLGWSKDPATIRPGDHRVRRVDIEAGVVFAEAAIQTTSPTAADHDWVFVADREPDWSPYP